MPTALEILLIEKVICASRFSVSVTIKTEDYFHVDVIQAESKAKDILYLIYNHILRKLG